MKILLPLFALGALSSSALAQTQPDVAVPTASVPVPTTPLFRDVPPGHWAFAAVQRLASAGIVEGYAGTAATTTQTVAKIAPAPVVVKSAVKPVKKVGAKKVVAAKVKAAR